SRARLLPQEMSNSLVCPCFSSVFHLPPQTGRRGLEAFLYSKTLAAMDSMLQTLVRSAGTLGLLELQNILQFLLPFTDSQLAGVQERAVARIAELTNFITTYTLLQLCPCFAQATRFTHQCPEAHRFLVLGRLVGHLTLCCTSKNSRTCEKAVRALYNLHVFILQQKTWLRVPLSPHSRDALGDTLGDKSPLLSFIPQMLVQYLRPSDRVDVMLMAIKSLRSESTYSIKVAAHMVEVLVKESDFRQAQLLKIVEATYRTLPSILSVVACNSLHRALLVLSGKHPREMVASLLQCSLTCTCVAVNMWKAMLSEPHAAQRVLGELLRTLMNPSPYNTSPKDNPRILSLAAARAISEILLQEVGANKVDESPCLQEVEAVFPQLFLAMLFQVSFTAELTLQEVSIFWKEDQENLLAPIRSAVQGTKRLLCSMGCESQVAAIEALGGWEALLSAQSHLTGVRVVAREMMKTPTDLRTSIFRHVVQFLRVEDPTREMVIMVFLIEMLDCTDLSRELDRALAIFPMYLQSQCLGMSSLVLRGILRLTERPDTARRTLVLMQHVVKQLQSADSDAAATALLVLRKMLQLLEGNAPSRTALVLASELQPLFDHESDTVRELSIQLFQSTMGLVVQAEKRKMKQVVWDSLLPLLFHLHDENKNVAKASQEALHCAGLFLKWRQLAQLAETAQVWRISECLLARKRSRAEVYLRQSQPYLQSPQETLRQEAVRFI
ncbi:MROH7 protein, partial [Lophotis ruficrista]|nr:MROH7 protein [Lophotis ruficrista]